MTSNQERAAPADASFLSKWERVIKADTAAPAQQPVADNGSPERLWLGCADPDGYHEVWFDPYEGGAEYIRARTALTRAESSLASPAGMEGWQPIETAPRDGTEFQSWMTRDDLGGWWEPRCRFNPDTEAFEVWGRVDYDQDGWDVYSGITVVGWMPEPSAPPPRRPTGRSRMSPKQAYERRRAEREAKLAASEKRYGRAPIFDPESNELFDMIDRFVTAAERIADAVERRSLEGRDD